MNIQLNKLVIWSRKQPVEKKEIIFQHGKLNVIHGASQTGKSAIISIIDYCLCSSKYSIPEGVIREKVSWFGLELSIDDKTIFIARENKKSLSKFYFTSGNNIEIPNEIIPNEENKQKLRDKINNLLGVPFFQLNEYTKKGARPSFRDLVTFNFQPQNIVANPNCLLYKTDIAEYRDRIREIFNFAIGVETGESLAEKQLYQSISKKIEALREEKKNKKEFLDNEILNRQDFILTSMKYNLINKDDYIPNNIGNIVSCLEKIIENDLSSIKISINGTNQCLLQQQKIMDEITPLMERFRSMQIAKKSIEDILALSKEGHELLLQQKRKLEIAEFLKVFAKKYADEFAKINIDRLCLSLHNIEDRIRREKFSKHSVFEKKLAEINDEFNQLKNIINEKLSSYNKIQSSLENRNIIDDFMQQIGEAKTLLNFYNQDLTHYDEEIKKYEDMRPKQYNVNNKLGIALKDIRDYMQMYKPTFSEFDYISKFDTKNLTVKVSDNTDADDFYLWETGSGANWVAYHLAALLGFHRYFVERNCPVFNFIIFDQPTQVYFPTSKYDEDKQLYVFNADTPDYKEVKEMYKYMDEAVQNCKGKLQVIVLDHTDESIWNDLKTINDVADWSDRKRDALIPSNW